MHPRNLKLSVLDESEFLNYAETFMYLNAKISCVSTMKNRKQCKIILNGCRLLKLLMQTTSACTYCLEFNNVRGAYHVRVYVFRKHAQIKQQLFSSKTVKD
jgi:hypothetical protein